MKSKNQPAFPQHQLDPSGSGEYLIRGSMSLRDYFIAHAPAEPQPWFEPEMPERPRLPDQYAELMEEQREIWGRYEEEDPEDIPDPVVRDFAVRRNEALNQRIEWYKERKKQRYIQWPAAWADAMLADRERSGGDQ